MVFVKVRETYDLHTVTNKLTAIGIHTPAADIIQRNYPGLLMQCKAYRPVSCDVRLACASMLPVDPLGVGTGDGDIAPEDLFNPILYKAVSNIGMSQIEARIQGLANDSITGDDVRGSTAIVDQDSVTTASDEFDLYYGMLSDTHQWKHASPQSGLSMSNLKPFVYEMLYSVGDNCADARSSDSTAGSFALPAGDGTASVVASYAFKGNAKPMPFINCTSYTAPGTSSSGLAEVGFKGATAILNGEVFTPAPLVYVGCIIVPPSRLHQLFYRMVVEWTLEFSTIRTVGEITNWTGLAMIGSSQHYQSYDFSAAKAAIGLTDESLPNDTSTVSANVDINKVM